MSNIGQPDTSDLYKFFSTLGVILIASSLFIFWTISNSYNIYLIKNEELTNITSFAKDIIIKMQEDISDLYNHRFLFSSIVFIIGLISLFYGITNWKKLQFIIDKTNKIKLAELLNNKMKKQTKEQKDERVRSEARETVGKEPDSEIPENITNNYKKIEEKVVNIINQKYKNDFIIRNNVIFENTEYDVIMIPYIPNKKQMSISKNIFNIEIKYYKNVIQYPYLINGYRKYLLLANKFVTVKRTTS